MLDKEAFLPSHKYMVDKARILHTNGKINDPHLSFLSVTLNYNTMCKFRKCCYLLKTPYTVA